MSGFSGVLAAASGIAQLLAPPCSLGGVTFDTYEIPERMPWGGEQRIAVHEMPGGARVVDAMGPYDGPYEWSGIFSGPFAVDRARQVDAMRQAGASVTLTWGSFTYLVVIAMFRCEYTQKGNWLPYRIACVSIPTGPIVAAPSFLGSLLSDMSDAIGITPLINAVDPVLQSAQSAIQSVQSVLPIAGALTGGSSAFLSVANAVGKASGVIGTAASLSGSALTVLNAGTGFASGSAPSVVGAALNSAATLTGQVAGLQAMGNLVGRVAANLTGP